MTIITADGRKIQFCGDNDGADEDIVDRRVAERRTFDHNVPEQRIEDRREVPAPVVKPVRQLPTGPQMNSQVDARNIQLWMEDLLARIELRVGIDHTIISQDGTEEEIKCTSIG